MRKAVTDSPPIILRAGGGFLFTATGLVKQPLYLLNSTPGGFSLFPAWHRAMVRYRRKKQNEFFRT
jgi:hypothetical protein